jgi:thiamine biosynthesis lipoprotein
MYTHTCQYHDSSQLFHGAMTEIMGTRFDIVLPTKEKRMAEQTWEKIVLLLNRLDEMLNRFDPQSELSKINAEAHQNPILLTTEMLHILQLCAEYHCKTYGYFDVSLRDFSKVHIDEKAQTVCFSEKISLDLGGFAKGYAMKHLSQIVLNNGFENAFIDFGRSSITAFGHHPYGDCWKVSIGNPFDDDKVPGEFELRNASLSTSGNTPTYSGHIIDPFSGTYLDERKMVCVVAPNALDAEVLTTTLMIAPDAEKEKIVQNFEIEMKTEYYL